MAPDESADRVILAWKCSQCFSENFRALSSQVEVGRTLPLVCRACEAVTRETVWAGNLIPDRRKRPRERAWPR